MPQDIYVHLSGGRGDARVKAWDGEDPVDVQEVEYSPSPYRNTLPKQPQPLGSGWLTLGPGYVGIPATASSGGVDVTIVKDDMLNELNGTPTPPRSWQKTATWTVFNTAGGIRKFRKAEIIGWGDAPRT